MHYQEGQSTQVFLITARKFRKILMSEDPAILSLYTTNKLHKHAVRRRRHAQLSHRQDIVLQTCQPFNIFSRFQRVLKRICFWDPACLPPSSR